VIVVDDHRVLAEGLRTLLQPTHTVVALAHSGDDLLPILRTTPADCLLLDLMMPGQHGLALLPVIRRIQPALKIVILTMLLDREVAQACVQAGAHGYVPKDADSDEVLDAIAAVLAGERYLSPRIPKVTHRVGLAAAQPGFERLTPRQQEIVLLLGRGKRPAQIADALGVCRSTVTFHLKKAEQVLGLPSDTLRQWAVLMAPQPPPPPQRVRWIEQEATR
jgi:DNA-binding NarL/FixJ family response regulator